jgi:hypothetical protein
LGNWQLGGNQGRFAPVALFEDFEEIEALLVIEGVGPPVVEDEQLDTCELIDEAREATIEAGHGEVLEQARHTQVEDGMIEPGRLAAEGTRQPGFAGPGRARDIVPKNIRSKLSSNIRIIHALESVLLL